jgi:hypothetical protein
MMNAKLNNRQQPPKPNSSMSKLVVEEPEKAKNAKKNTTSPMVVTIELIKRDGCLNTGA